jgi:hypothetical protein
MMTVRRYFYFVLVVVGAAVAGPIVPRAAADTLISTDSGGYGGGFTAYSGNNLGQQFKLYQSTTITSVDLSLGDALGGLTLSGLSVSLYKDSSNVLGSLITTSSMPTGTLATSFSDVNFAFTNATLAAGTYWVVLSDIASASNASVEWQQQFNGPVTNSYGSINSRLFFDSSDYNNFSPQMMTIYGDTVQTVPEPSSLALGVACLLIVGGAATLRRGLRTGWFRVD